MSVNASASLSEFPPSALTNIDYAARGSLTLVLLGASGMVVEAAALRNSFYLDRAVEDTREHGEVVREEDLAWVSPLVREHINALGRYQFALEASGAKGGMRPFRGPAEIDEYELKVLRCGV